MTNVTDGPDVERRPVAVIGAGTLGSRIALMYAAGGSDVRIVNRSPERAEAARRYVHDHLSAVRHELGLNAAVAGNVEIGTPLERAIPGAWLVIESVAEDPQLKRQRPRRGGRTRRPGRNCRHELVLVSEQRADR